MEAIFLLRHLMKKYREACEDLYKFIIDLKSTWQDLKEVMWWVLEEKRVPLKYIKLIKDMYDGALTSVRTNGGITRELTINKGLHKKSALNLYLFALVMDELN